MIVVLDYGMGNVGSILNMLRKVGAEAAASADPAVVRAADKIILPGVGAFDTGMRNLTDTGLVDVLRERVIGGRTPLLGICLGMELLMERSEEGKLPGLGWLPGSVVRFRFDGSNGDLKIPHMGWNSIRTASGAPLVNDLLEGSRFYFVHSYHIVCDCRDDVAAWTEYGYEFASVVQRGNIMGTQFHPEKSHKYGMRLLRNFAEPT